MPTERVIRTKKHTEWDLYGPIKEFSEYEKLIKGLKEATEGDKIDLLVNCTGGRCDVGFMIVQAIRGSKAHIHCVVTYESYSMGSLIAIAGDSMEMLPNTFLMFHTYSGGTGGKSGDMIQHLPNMDSSLKGMFKDVCQPFLTKKEMMSIHKGHDLYVRAEDEDLQNRIKRHFK